MSPCPACGWRYGHGPECPYRHEDAIWWISIAVPLELVWLAVTFLIR